MYVYSLSNGNTIKSLRHDYVQRFSDFLTRKSIAYCCWARWTFASNRDLRPLSPSKYRKNSISLTFSPETYINLFQCLYFETSNLENSVFTKYAISLYFVLTSISIVADDIVVKYLYLQRLIANWKVKTKKKASCTTVRTWRFFMLYNTYRALKKYKINLSQRSKKIYTWTLILPERNIMDDAKQEHRMKFGPVGYV